MLRECTIEESPSGFGMYQRGEECPTLARTYFEWEGFARDAGVEVERVPRGESPWGCVEGGDYGRIYRSGDGEHTVFCGVRIAKARAAR